MEHEEEIQFYEGKRFKSFKEVETALLKYRLATNAVYVTGSSCSIENENKRLLAQGVAAHNLYSNELRHKNVKLVCKFGGARRIGKSSGHREFQSTFKIGCPSMIHLIARKDHLYVKKFIDKHEQHNCSNDELHIIPEARKVHSDDQATLDTLLEGKVRPSRIRMILRDTKSGRLTTRDIANIRTKKKREQQGGRSEAEMLVDTLCKISDEDPNSFIHVQKDEHDGLEVLFIQTSRMKRNVEKYGIVILFDHTYKINKNRLPVSIFKVMDGNGVGRCAGIAYVINEEKVTLSIVVQAFMDSVGQDVWRRIRTVVIDKDYSEANAMKELLPHVEIQLCDFHVSRTFTFRSVRESPRVKAIINDMRYTETEETFQELTLELEKVASKKFWEYFLKNWINCPLAWCFRDKKKAPHFGNTTTGRLERFNATIKLVLDSDSPLHESVEKLLELAKNKEEDVLYTEVTASVKHCYLTKNSDPVVTMMMNDITLYAAKKILAQKDEISNGIVCRPDTTLESCGCTHYIHTFLPCAHILLLRMKKGLCWYDSESILPMYKKSPATNPVHLGAGNPLVSVSVAPAKIVPKTPKDKFNHALAQGRKIATLLSECGQDQYQRRIQVLIDLWKLWAKGKEAAIVTVLAELSQSDPGESNAAIAEIIEEDAQVMTTEMTNFRNESNPGVSQSDPGKSNAVEPEKVQEDVPIAPLVMASKVIESTAGVNGQKSQASVAEDAPLCFCNKTTISLRASASSIMAGRPFWKCSQQPGCRFWRIAKSKLKERVVFAPLQDSDSSHQTCQDFEYNLGDDDENENLSLLLDQLDKSMDHNQGRHDSASSADYPNQLIYKNVLRDKLKNLSLPESVKHRGRPKGLGKTIHSIKGIQKKAAVRKARPLRSTEDLQLSNRLLCEKRGNEIHDSDVLGCGPNKWTVTSQMNRTKAHSVTKLYDSCSCLGSVCCDCFHCSCDDFKFRSHKRPCKHIFKVASLLKKSSVTGSDQGVTLTECPITENDVPAVSLEQRRNNHSTHQDDYFEPLLQRRNFDSSTDEGFPNHECDVQPKQELVKTTEEIEIIDLSSDAELEFDGKLATQTTGSSVADNQNAVPSFIAGDNDLLCTVCELIVVDSSQCFNCGKFVHIEDCSVRKPNGSEDDLNRICTICYCLLCKDILEIGHVCKCHICLLPTDSAADIICYRCERITHASTETNCAKQIHAKEKSNELRFICKSCLYASTTRVSLSVRNQITGNEILSDEHIVRASVMLSTQFKGKIDGLCMPMAVIHGKGVENKKYYPPHTNDVPLVQILNTGKNHWVTAIFLKHSNVKIMDSQRSIPITGHVKIQVAMIAHSKERIIMARPPCKQQTNPIDCGLFAIANATEFCFTSAIQYVDFDTAQLRSHWLRCLESGTLTQFPCLSKRPKKVKELEEFEVLNTYCICHLPSNYGDMIACDAPACGEWFHYSCVGYTQTDAKDVEWFCPQCRSKQNS